MKTKSILLAIVLIHAVSCAEKQPQHDSKYLEIMLLPVGIEVEQKPDEIKAEKGGSSGLAYTWAYETSVSSLEKELTIIEFGCFAQAPDKSWIFSNYTGKPFTGSDFEEWYSCPNAVILKDSTFTDPNNWNGSDQLDGGVMLWYFIGVDPGGNKYRGTTETEFLSELKE